LSGSISCAEKRRKKIYSRSFKITGLALFAMVGASPMLIMLFRALAGDSGFEWAGLQDAHYAGLLGRSLAIALSAAVMSAVMGTFQALILVRVKLAGRRLWNLVCLVPLCIPAHVHAIAWICLLGDRGILSRFFEQAGIPVNIYSPCWVAVVLALAFHPLVTLIVSGGLLTMDRRLEQAALQYHKPARVLGRITLPLVFPHVMAGAVFVLIFAFFEYGVAALLRVHTYPVEIFAQFSAFYNEAAATALALPVMVAALVLLAGQRLWMGSRSYVVLNTGRQKPERFDPGRMKVCFIIALLILACLGTGLPLAMLTTATGGARAFAAVWQSTSSTIFFTVFLAGLASLVVVCLAWVLADIRQSCSARFRTMLDIVFYVPFAMPATVVGIGLIYLWNRPQLHWVYGTPAILVLAYLARFLPFAIQAVLAGLAQVESGIRKAARLYQGSWWKRTWKIELRLCFPALAAGWAMVFVLCTGELGATLLVVPPGAETISLKLYTLMHYGASQAVAALSLILVAINLACAAGAVLSVRMLGWNR